MSASENTQPSNAIAIIGAGCRLPGGVESPEEYWAFLRRGGDGVVPTPPERWSKRFQDRDKQNAGTSYVSCGGFLQRSLAEFDPSFFGMSPREAAIVDPQQRLLLEVAADALDDAGLPHELVQGSATGVYVGGFTLDNMVANFATDQIDSIEQHTATSSSMTLLSNRVSYTFNLRGPSLTLDTACSSSLVATHLGCQSILSGESEMALVGGVNVMLLPNYQIVMCKGGFLAADGRSKTFDARGDGYGRGEGAVFLVLKSLDKALADGDAIRAVILGTGVNQDGATQGIAQPNQDAQYELIRSVCWSHGIDPASIDYVEAHGTGTRAGDPVELGAIGRSYGEGRTQPLPVGSVKANFGHLEAAAGVAGLLKATLSLQYGEVVPQVNFFEPNPDIDFEHLNVRVPVRAERLRDRARAAVNSFGYGGTNAHAILEAPPAPPEAQAVKIDRDWLLPVSARSEEARANTAERLADFLETRTDLALADIVGSVAHRRSHMEYRALLAGDSRDALVQQLRALAAGDSSAPTGTTTPGGLVWLFTGMGPQWWAMGVELYEKFPIFRAAVDAADEAFHEHAGRSIKAEMFRSRDASNMPRNDIAQPANFVIQAGLIALLRELGATPDAIIGHSVGEISAAYAAGCITLDEAARIVAHRARLIQGVAGKGTMLAVGCSAAEVAPYIADIEDVCIAAYNAPELVTLSGGHDALAEVEARIGDAYFNKRVRVEVAYHSAHMDPIRDEFVAALDSIVPSAPRIPLYSTVTGARVESAIHDAEYWWSNARGAVQLQHALESALIDGHRAFLEVGPHPVLASSVQANMQALAMPGVTFYSMARQTDEAQTFHNSIVELYLAGHAPNWRAFGPASFSFVRLPAYAWCRETHWDDRLNEHFTSTVEHPFLGERLDTNTPTWRGRIGSSETAWLRDHVIQGEPITPGAAYVEAMLAGVRDAYMLDDQPTAISKLRFDRAMALPASEVANYLQVEVGEKVTVSSRRDGEWGVHAEAAYAHGARYETPSRVDLEALFASCDANTDVDCFYADLAGRGLEYGRAFRTVRTIATGPEQVVAELDGRLALETGYHLHPAVLDGAFQALFAAVPNDDDATWLPMGIERVVLRGRAPLRLFVHGVIRHRDDDRFVSDLALFDVDGNAVAEVIGLSCERVAESTAGVDESWFHREEWVPTSIVAAPATDGRRIHVVGAPTEMRDALVDIATAGASVSVSTTLRFACSGDIIWLSDGHDSLAEDLEGLRSLTDREDINSLTVVTFGAMQNGLDVPANPAERAIWGFMRVMMTEHPQLSVRLVDLAGREQVNRADLQTLLALSSNHEEETLVRSGNVLARRIRRGRKAAAEAVSVDPRETPIELIAQQTGSLDSLVFARSKRTPPSAGEIEIEVDATSLNFKDVMKVMGMLSDVALESTYLGNELGLEASGRVVRVGEGADFEVGERVFLYKGGTLRSHVTVDARFAARVPETLDACEAATIFVFLTSWYSLVTRGNLRAGERVLIHSAAGGVGLSAVQIAQHLGAEVFATAGTPEKREYLRSLGVEHVWNSRTLDWEREVLAATNGEGVDVVLNALAGPAIEAGLNCLGPGGRFIELGKKDIASDRSLGMLPFNRNLSLLAVDLDRMAEERPSFFAPLAAEVAQAFDSGALQPIRNDVFGPDAVVAAFRALASGDQIGKVVLDLRDARVDAIEPPDRRFEARADAAYLVTGGLAGFGLSTAEWLAQSGAKSLYLGSRRGTAPAESAETLARIEALGAKVHEIALDVTDTASIANAFAKIDAAGQPLAGVFHAAAVIDDALVAELTIENLERTMSAKAVGASLLHAATVDRGEVDQFVLFSSISATVGNPGQAAYAAANAYLEGLADARIAQGLPATVVGWGAIGGAGVVARDASLAEHLRLLGIHTLDAPRALDALSTVLEPQLGYIGIVDIDWNTWSSAMSATPWNRLENLLETTDNADADANTDLLATLVATAAEVFGTSADKLDVTRPLRDMGLDSLMAVELQTMIARRLGVELSVMELLAGLGLEALSVKLASRMEKGDSTVQEVAHESSTSFDTTQKFLERILVHPPYFALSEMEVDGELVLARATPDEVEGAECGPVTSAEAGRHLAILGSCAASIHDNARPGRHVYPVKRAVLRMNTELPADLTLEDATRLSARCLSYSPTVARSRGYMSTNDGQLLATLDCDYHVIEEAHFRRIMSAHARPTGEHVVEGSPYESLVVPSDGFVAGAQYILEFEVTPDMCLGHFPGVPTLPVSIMGRFVMQAVERAIGGRPEPRVSEAIIDTYRFIHCGETVRFVASAMGERYRCDVMAGSTLAARFDLDLREQQQVLRRSGAYAAATWL